MAPVAVGNKVARTTPKMTMTADVTTISHMEYVSDINIVTTSSAIGMRCNPQDATMFTWLSAVATRFEMYRFKKLKFHYKPSTSTTTNGFVVLAFDFDVYDSEPSKSTMLAWKYAAKSAVWQQCALDVGSDARISTYRYCNTTYPSGSDKRLDDIGKLWILPQGSAVAFVGELFVEYVVELRQPAYKIPPALYSTITCPGSTQTAPFSTTTLTSIGNLAYTILSGNQIRLDSVGQFLVTLFQEAVSGTFTGNPAIVFSTPAGSPSADYDAVQADQVVGTLKGLAEYYLNVTVPPVLLTTSAMTGSAGGNNYNQVVKLATRAYA